MREQLRFLILHHFLTIAGIVKRFEWGGAEPCAGSDKKYLTAHRRLFPIDAIGIGVLAGESIEEWLKIKVF